MALLQHGAACLRGLVPLSRKIALSRKSSSQVLKCKSLQIRNFSDEQHSAPDNTAGLPNVEATSSSFKSIGTKNQLQSSAATTLQNKSAKLKDIVDIYGPYEEASGSQPSEVVAASIQVSIKEWEASSTVQPVSETRDSIDQAKSAAEKSTENRYKSVFDQSITKPPSVTRAITKHRKLIDSPLKEIPTVSEVPLKLQRNLTSSIGTAEPLPTASHSDHSAYAAFSAFAIIPLILVLVASWLTYSSYRSKRRPLEIRIGKQSESGNGASRSTLIQQIVERLPQLNDVYKPYPFLTNPHVETIFAAFFRTLPDIRFRRECLAAPDGGTVALDWPVHGGKRASDDAMWSRELPTGSPVLILLPGLTGGSQDTYVRHMLVRARRAGFNVVVFNSRGCGDSPVTSPQFYSASFTDDMRMVTAHVQRTFPDSKLFAIGWSLGANILVRYLGQEGTRTPIAAAASLCNPFDLVKGDEGFHKGFGKVYDKSLAKSLNRIFKKHAALFEGLGGDFNIPMVATAQSVRDFDEGLTRVSFGFPTVDEYYRQSSSINNIQDVTVPLMCIQAEDDPIAPNDGIPRKKIEENPNTFLVVTPAGGHLGWIAGEEAPLGAPWTDPLVIDFFKAFLELQPEGRKGTPDAEKEVNRTLQEVRRSNEGEELEVSKSWNKR